MFVFLLDPPGPVDLDVRVLYLLPRESRPVLVVLVLLDDVEQDVSALEVPPRLLDDDFLEQIQVDVVLRGFDFAFEHQLAFRLETDLGALDVGQVDRHE